MANYSMLIMSFESFVDYVVEKIADLLPEEYSTAKIGVQKVTKNNDQVMHGLSIFAEGNNVSPTIYLEPYYERYQAGEMDIDQVLRSVADTYLANSVPGIDADQFTKWENVAGCIKPFLVKGEGNDQAKELVHKEHLDMVVTYYIELNSIPGIGSGTVAIRKEMLEKWGVTEEQLHEQAMENLVEGGFCFQSMVDTMMELLQDQGIEQDIEIPDDPSGMYVLTNRDKARGAACMLNDSALAKIHEKMGDFFILPSSIHEVLCLPMADGADPDELRAMVQEINRMEVLPQEVLSDNVYKYTMDGLQIA